MRAMKDSGIEWIGEIPQEWSTIRLRSRFSFGKGLPITKADLTESGIGVVSYGQIHSKANIGTTIKPELIRYVDCKYLNSNASSLVNNGDFIFADTSEDISGCGNCVYVDANGPLFAGYHTMILRPVEELSTKYYSYLFATDAWRSQIRAQASGVKLFSITQKMLRDALLIEPSEEEKVQIVKYLDEKCEAIDALITAKEKTNALLKERRQSIIYEAVTKGLNPDAPMKDSGVEWIGEIPEHWTRIALKYCIKQVGSGTSVNAEDRPANTDEMGVLKTSCVSSGCFAALENKAILENEYDRATCPVKAYTVIVSRMNTPDLVGACGYVEEDHPNLYLPDRLWQVEFNKDCVAKYMWYFLTSKYVRNYYASVCTGTSGSMQNISQDQFGAIAFFKPSKTEQQSIAEYLDRECETLLSLIDVNEQSLQKLKEYRQCIIYEAVTGKIEV